MRETSFKKFCALAKQGDYIPVFKEILLDLDTPVSIYSKVLRKEKNSFLLESVELGKNLGRFSFIGIRPSKIFYSEKNTTTTLNQSGKKVRVTKKPILEVLRQILAKRKTAVDKELEGAINGLIGFLSFEEVEKFESVQFRKKTREHSYDAVFFLTETLLVFDHISRSLRVVKIQKKSRSLKKDFLAAHREIDRFIREIHLGESPGNLKKRKKKSKKVKVVSSIGKKKFMNQVSCIKKYIREGDAIQVVFSHKFKLGKVPNSFHIYRALRSINPSPYMFYFQFKNFTMIGSSPEVLVKKEGNTAVVRPIAGTRPRGESRREDKKYEEDLKRSRKEMAEHLMLVDLGRNDIGRVCKKGTVKVDRFAYIEKYSHVMHLVSNVEGKLKPNKDAIDLIEATFPAGTVSGAPKIRAMEIIDELESVKRGPYSGALGYISFSGEMDLCITIRTIFIDKGKAYLQAGAGIVYDSNPQKEYEETVNKAKALFKAVEMAEGF